MPRDTDHHIEAERAIAPIVSVMLMVLLTVILAAAVGTFVMDVGEGAVDSPPRASISIRADTGNDTITIQHEGGDALHESETTVQLTNESSGEMLTFAAGGGQAVFDTNDELDIHVDSATGAELVGGPWSKRTADGSMTLASGVQYTVRIVDAPTDRLIAELTIHG